jgi:DNA-binding NarL/FixJ family response regulator
LIRPPRFERGSAAEAAIDAESESHAGAPPLPVHSILVVEDDAGWRSILSELLADADLEAEVRLCNGYGEALGCLQRHDYVLAVVDLALRDSVPGSHPGKPALDGVELLARLQALDIPTIVVSGVAEAALVTSLYERWSIFAYLEKQTFDRRAFLRTVHEAIEAASSDHVLDALTPRETEVLTLIAQGMTNKGIADALVISVNTVKRHLRSIYDKLDVHSRAAATAIAVRGGLSIEHGVQS